MKPLHRKGGKKHWQGLSVSFTTEDDGAVFFCNFIELLTKDVKHC